MDKGRWKTHRGHGPHIKGDDMNTDDKKFDTLDNFGCVMIVVVAILCFTAYQIAQLFAPKNPIN